MSYILSFRTPLINSYPVDINISHKQGNSVEIEDIGNQNFDVFSFHPPATLEFSPNLVQKNLFSSYYGRKLVS